MHCAFRLGSLLAALALLPLLALGQAQQGKVDTAKLRAQQLGKAFIEGKLTEINEEKNTFTFQYTHKVAKANKDGQAKLVQISQQFNKALATRSTSLDQLKQLQEQGRAAYKAAYDIEETPITFELKGEKNLVIRTMIPPMVDGKPKKLTPAELSKLKGAPGYPGYQATIKDLDTKEHVRIYIDKLRKPAGKDAESTVYPITMIVIIPEPPDPTDPFKIPGS